MRDIFELESRYKETLERFKEWSYLRVAVAFYLKSRDNSSKISKNSYLDRLKSGFRRLKEIFYGFKNWFRGYDYILFSSSDQRKLVNGAMYDKLCDPIIDKLGADRALMVELANPNRYSNSYTKYITSKELLLLIQRVLAITLIPSKGLIEIENILKREEINIDLKRQERYFRAGYYLFNILFKIYRPKAIFIVCSYCSSFIIKSAKRNKIEVIELQHGIISKSHFGYISHINLKEKDKIYPNYLLSFGEINLNRLLIERVYPVGSFYLEYIKRNFQPSKEILDYKKRYKTLIGISMQNANWEIDYLKRVINDFARRDKKSLFILIPRNNLIVKEFIKSDNSNIVWFNKLDCYQTILHCDIHLTLYSSCAIEAPFLGIPNILINIRNFAKSYYSDLLNEKNSIILEDGNYKEFSKAVEHLKQFSRDEVKESFRYIRPNYNRNLDSFLNKLNLRGENSSN